MTTVYSVYNSEGCVGRCDAKCHDAEGPECHCICGGANHGVGERIALEDRKFLSDLEILSNCEKTNADNSLKVFRPGRQLELFSRRSPAERAPRRLSNIG